MNELPYDTPERLAARLTELEMLFTHLQQTVQDLDAVVLEQHRRIDKLEQKLGRLTHDFGALQDSFVEERKPEDEKPPHY